MTQITIDRALVEQALGALEEYAPQHGRPDDMMVAITAFRAALAQPKSETCTWHQDGDSDSGTYSTSCGRYFSLEDGTPEDNRMEWCCYCGKTLAQELIAEETK